MSTLKQLESHLNSIYTTNASDDYMRKVIALEFMQEQCISEFLNSNNRQQHEEILLSMQIKDNLQVAKFKYGKNLYELIAPFFTSQIGQIQYAIKTATRTKTIKREYLSQLIEYFDWIIKANEPKEVKEEIEIRERLAEMISEDFILKTGIKFDDIDQHKEKL